MNFLSWNLRGLRQRDLLGFIKRTEEHLCHFSVFGLLELGAVAAGVYHEHELFVAPAIPGQRAMGLNSCQFKLSPLRDQFRASWPRHLSLYAFVGGPCLAVSSSTSVFVAADAQVPLGEQIECSTFAGERRIGHGDARSVLLAEWAMSFDFVPASTHCE
eukprot:6466079-Amphidinium_carterae.1